MYSSTGIAILSHVERLVADALSNQDLKVIPGEYRLIHEQGATELTFRRIDRQVGDDLQLSAIATHHPRTSLAMASRPAPTRSPTILPPSRFSQRRSG